MSLIATHQDGEGFAPVPAGNHVAICIALYDIGTQYDQMYDRWKPQVIVTWEIPGETVERDGETKPMTISKFYSVYLTEKANLYKDLTGWRGRAFIEEELARFDLNAILGKPCMLNVIHKGDKARVASVASIPKGIVVPPPVHPLVSFDLDLDPTGTEFEALPDWVQKHVLQSREKGEVKENAPQASTTMPPHQAMVAAGGVDEEDDIPF